MSASLPCTASWIPLRQQPCPPNTSGGTGASHRSSGESRPPAAIWRVADRRPTVRRTVPRARGVHILVSRTAGARFGRDSSAYQPTPRTRLSARIVGPGSATIAGQPDTHRLEHTQTTVPRRALIQPPPASRRALVLTADRSGHDAAEYRPAPPKPRRAAAMASSSPGFAVARDPVGSSNRPGWDARRASSDQRVAMRERGLTRDRSPSSSASPSFHCASRDSSRSSSCSICRSV